MNLLGLSKCEFEIVERISLGESKKEVADRTNRSVHTVETTLKNVYSKLGINKVTDLILLYCGYTFNISQQISEKKKEILASLLFVIFSSTVYTDTSHLINARFIRNRRRHKTELTLEN
ncbi:MAG: hypothetical protein GX102_04755 [Porphyromonadaceae bacterium]|jgi:DNA-binding CsgD family transcriptional regulator|nr:hypothetical protein [Porphyromonadaceae bacterium]